MKKAILLTTTLLNLGLAGHTAVAGARSDGGPASAPYLESIKDLQSVLRAPISDVLGRSATILSIQFLSQSTNDEGNERYKIYKVLGTPGSGGDGSENCAAVTLVFKITSGSNPYLPTVNTTLEATKVAGCSTLAEPPVADSEAK